MRDLDLNPGLPAKLQTTERAQALVEFARRVSAIGGAQTLGMTYRPKEPQAVLDLAIHWEGSHPPLNDMRTTLRKVLTRRYHQDLAKKLFPAGINVYMEDIYSDYWPGRREDERTDFCTTPEDFRTLLSEWTEGEKGEKLLTISLPLFKPH